VRQGGTQALRNRRFRIRTSIAKNILGSDVGDGDFFPPIGRVVPRPLFGGLVFHHVVGSFVKSAHVGRDDIERHDGEVSEVLLPTVQSPVTHPDRMFSVHRVDRVEPQHRSRIRSASLWQSLSKQWPTSKRSSPGIGGR